MGIAPIRVEGLAQFTRAVKRADSNLAKEVRHANNAVADIVIRKAKPRVPIGPAAGGHAKSSIKARSTRTEARITAGGARFPYYPWLDFGGRVGINNSVSRPFLKEGRYIWAAYADSIPEIEATLTSLLADVARSAGLEVD